jgi:glycosyltransferase involved in cell wall biosynthesis
MKLLILVPVFNEWPHLLPVLQNLRAHFSEILVIDDGSDDKSYLNLLKKEGFEYIYIFLIWGIGGPFKRVSSTRSPKSLMGSLPLTAMGSICLKARWGLFPLLEQGFDVVIGKDNDRGGWSRKFCRGILNRLSGLDISDFTSGLRGYSRIAMGHLIQGSFLNLDYQDLGVLFMAKKKGLQLVEVPVSMESEREKNQRSSPISPALCDIFSSP